MNKPGLDSRRFMFCWEPDTNRAALVPWPDPADIMPGVAKLRSGDGW